MPWLFLLVCMLGYTIDVLLHIKRELQTIRRVLVSKAGKVPNEKGEGK